MGEREERKKLLVNIFDSQVVEFISYGVPDIQPTLTSNILLLMMQLTKYAAPPELLALIKYSLGSNWRFRTKKKNTEEQLMATARGMTNVNGNGN